MRNKQFPMVCLVFLILTISVISMAHTPYWEPMAIYRIAAQALVNGQKVQNDFYPIGYTAFLAACLKLGGFFGIFIGQALLYMITIILGYQILKFLEVNQGLAFGAAALLAFHPYLVVNIKRIVENNIAVPLMLALVFCLAWAKKHGITPGRAVLTGLVFGCSILVRPNLMIFLILIVGLWMFDKTKPLGTRWFFLGVTLMTASLTTVAVNWPVASHLVILTSNGPYNFFAGANVFTAKLLIPYYNIGEPFFLKKTLPYYHLHLTDPGISSTFVRLGFDYIKHHPLEYAYLCVLKLFDLFRPDFRLLHVSTLLPKPSMFVLLQTAIAVPFVGWVFLRILCRRVVRAWDGLMALPVTFLYVLPFVLISSDPRYRMPLDMVLILDSVYCWAIYRNRPRLFNNRGAFVR